MKWMDKGKKEGEAVPRPHVWHIQLVKNLFHYSQRLSFSDPAEAGVTQEQTASWTNTEFASNNQISHSPLYFNNPMVS